MVLYDYLFFVHPLIFIVFILAQAISMNRTGWKSPVTKFCRRMVILQLVMYVLGFLALCYEPYYYDMGAKEFIDWGLRWLLAFIVASFIEMYILPFALIFFGFLYARETKQRNEENYLVQK